jgi:hypothetical protein
MEFDMQYSFIRTITAAALACLVSTGTALAEKNPPKGSQPTDPQVIGKLYNGKTSYWDRGGSAYWGPGGVLESTGAKGNAYGKGKWYVTNTSKLCQEATFYWTEGNAVKSEDWKGCWEFATAPDGVIWERFLPEKSEWYKHKTEKQKNGNGNAKVFKANGKNIGF